MENPSRRRVLTAGLTGAAATLFAYAVTTKGWQVYAFFVVGSLGALAYPALNGVLSKMVDASRQGALQGGLGAMNSVAAIFGPIIAAQSLAIGSRHGFVGAAFLVAGALLATSALIIALFTRKAALARAVAAE